MEFVYRSRSQTNDLLNRIGEKLQLDNTRRERAEASYKAVGEFINDSESIFRDIDSEIYAQGSFAIQTTVKPVRFEEFDLDFVFEMQVDFKKFPEPSAILDILAHIFEANGRYSAIYEKKNRCIRLNYANEFHMDILPACPDYELGGTNLKVPDSESKSWVESNPRGYIRWFEDRCQELRFMEKMAQIDPIPDDLPYELKPPLKRAVQLMKRFRDVYFNGRDGKPRSIVITTLAGMYYQNEDDVFETINNSLIQVNALINRTDDDDVISIENPANRHENLTDKWKDNPNSEEYKLFKNFYRDFATQWSRLAHISNEDDLIKVLGNMFGENVSKEAIKEASDYQLRKASQASPVIITSPTKPWGLNELV